MSTMPTSRFSVRWLAEGSPCLVDLAVGVSSTQVTRSSKEDLQTTRYQECDSPGVARIGAGRKGDETEDWKLTLFELGQQEEEAGWDQPICI